MHLRKILPWLIAGQLAASLCDASSDGVADAQAPLSPAEPLDALTAEVIERNPEIARARRLAAAAAARAPQARALPDPTADVSLFVLPPETRVGPQRLNVRIEQRIPGFGKLALAERVALHHAEAAEADVEAAHHDQVAAAHRAAWELAFLDAQEDVVDSERSALVRYERAAQARYAAGTGLQQESVRIQAQITRIDTRLLDIEERRIALRADLNRLRDRPPSTPVALPSLVAVDTAAAAPDTAALVEAAMAYRPELRAADAHIAAARATVELAERRFRPGFAVGLSYSAVERRRDRAGRLDSPEDDGDDVFALTSSVNLPRRRPRAAALVEAEALLQVAEEDKRRLRTAIESTIGDLTSRLPLLARHLDLLEKVLTKQAAEALRSAETAYSTGRISAVDLLDAEVVLLDVRIAAARTRADLAIARIHLEHAVARPLATPEARPSHDS